jgi:hypothetical protein
MVVTNNQVLVFTSIRLLTFFSFLWNKELGSGVTRESKIQDSNII